MFNFTKGVRTTASMNGKSWFYVTAFEASCVPEGLEDERRETRDGHCFTSLRTSGLVIRNLNLANRNYYVKVVLWLLQSIAV